MQNIAKIKCSCSFSVSSQRIMKRIIYHDIVGFIPGMQGWLTFESQSMSFTTKKKKTCMFIAMDAKMHLIKFHAHL